MPLDKEFLWNVTQKCKCLGLKGALSSWKLILSGHGKWAP